MLKTKLTEANTIQIDDEKFESYLNKDLKNIISILEENGFQVRVVGGAVRDILLGLEPRDIDILTDATPDEVIFCLNEEDIQADVWGISHGTVKAIMGNTKYEITSINFQMFKEDGKIHTVDTASWKEDALRRDYTVNSLSMTLGGEVFDYANGITDIEKQIIRPLPNFEEKIKRDPVTALRFFKMLTKFESPKFSKDTLKTIEDTKDYLKNISKDRIKKELKTIKDNDKSDKILKLMDKLGILSILK